MYGAPRMSTSLLCVFFGMLLIIPLIECKHHKHSKKAKKNHVHGKNHDDKNSAQKFHMMLRKKLIQEKRENAMKMKTASQLSSQDDKDYNRIQQNALPEETPIVASPPVYQDIYSRVPMLPMLPIPVFFNTAQGSGASGDFPDNTDADFEGNQLSFYPEELASDNNAAEETIGDANIEDFYNGNDDTDHSEYSEDDSQKSTGNKRPGNQILHDLAGTARNASILQNIQQSYERNSEADNERRGKNGFSRQNTGKKHEGKNNRKGNRERKLKQSDMEAISRDDMSSNGANQAAQQNTGQQSGTSQQQPSANEAQTGQQQQQKPTSQATGSQQNQASNTMQNTATNQQGDGGAAGQTISQLAGQSQQSGNMLGQNPTVGQSQGTQQQQTLPPGYRYPQVGQSMPMQQNSYASYGMPQYGMQMQTQMPCQYPSQCPGYLQSPPAIPVQMPAPMPAAMPAAMPMPAPAQNPMQSDPPPGYMKIVKGVSIIHPNPPAPPPAPMPTYNVNQPQYQAGYPQYQALYQQPYIYQRPMGCAPSCATVCASTCPSHCCGIMKRDSVIKNWWKVYKKIQSRKNDE